MSGSEASEREASANETSPSKAGKGKRMPRNHTPVCVPCRHWKRFCDRARPTCGHSVRLGKVATCEYLEKELNACRICRRKRRNCDRTRPTCERCSRDGDASACEYPVAISPFKCARCRCLSLRCSREKPACTECLRLGPDWPCEYSDDVQAKE